VHCYGVHRQARREGQTAGGGSQPCLRDVVLPQCYVKFPLRFGLLRRLGEEHVEATIVACIAVMQSSMLRQWVDASRIAS
jgi:hypothetical protein